MFVTQTHTVWGGIEWWVHHLAQRMMDRGWEVYAGLAQGARFSDPGPYAAAHPLFRPVIMDGRAGTESARIAAVLGALRRVKPDVVIPVAIGATFEAIRSFNATFIVPVLSLHEGTLADVLEFDDVIDLAVPNSRLLERFLQNEIDPARVRYVRQGTPLATTARPPRTPRLRAAVVCRLEESTKRVLDLPRVADLIGDDIELHVYGDGPDREELAKAMDNRAVMHGYMSTEQLYRLAYPNFDVLLHFSPAEGSPNVIYEAMQNGVVPVSSRFMGSAVEGILRDGENALLFDVGDAAAAARHLNTLAKDRGELERLSGAARRANASYTDDNMYDAWIDVIESTPHRERALHPEMLPQSGRLDRALPPAAANVLRHIFGLGPRPATGWEEWPGSQQSSAAIATGVTEQLAAIEESAKHER
jgi:glycosyltransferase involved in cell wall biosynthesis